MREGKKEAHSQFVLSFFLFLKAADSISLSLFSLSFLKPLDVRMTDYIHYSPFILSLFSLTSQCCAQTIFRWGPFFSLFFHHLLMPFSTRIKKLLKHSLSLSRLRTNMQMGFRHNFRNSPIRNCFSSLATASFSRHITHHNVRKLSSFSRFNRDPFTVGFP